MKTVTNILWALMAMLLLSALFVSIKVSTACSFTMVETTMFLDGSCTTTETIYIPDGYTLHGNDFAITAVDPPGGHFMGAVIQNEGAFASVTKLTVTASGLADVCDVGDNRLRGIMFDGASGKISHSAVLGINQGSSRCHEGNAIEIRNAPYDGTHPDTKTVDIQRVHIYDYQNTGIVVNGDVTAIIRSSRIGQAFDDEYLPANSVQFGFGSSGSLNHNAIAGNSLDGPAKSFGTAILIYLAEDIVIKKNNVGGADTDIGILAAWSGIIDIRENNIWSNGDKANGPYSFALWLYENTGYRSYATNDIVGWADKLVEDNLSTVYPFEP